MPTAKAADKLLPKEVEKVVDAEQATERSEDATARAQEATARSQDAVARAAGKLQAERDRRDMRDNHPVSFNRAWVNHWRRTTLKREVACLGLGFWGFLTVKVFFYSTVEMIGALTTVYSSASTMIWLFAGASFGLDSLAKQFSDKSGANASG